MRTILSFLFWIQLTLGSYAQRVVLDRNHFNIVNENGAVRFGAEATSGSYLNAINSRLSDIKLNIGTLVLVQDLIRGSLIQVNHALKSGLSALEISKLSAEILSSCRGMITQSSSAPQLLLFAEDVAYQAKLRSLRLAAEVSDFVLKEGGNVLMDYQKRDFLLEKIILELRVIRTLCYSMSSSMYWARVNGLLKTANPYKNFINQDARLAEDILVKMKSLKLH